MRGKTGAENEIQIEREYFQTDSRNDCALWMRKLHMYFRTEQIGRNEYKYVIFLEIFCRAFPTAGQNAIFRDF